MSEIDTPKIPVSLGIIGAAAVLFNLMGLYDCFQSLSVNEEYLSQIPGYLEFVQTMPFWAKSAWAIATSMGVLGSIFLLLRKAWAWPVYILSILGMIVTFTYQFTSEHTPEMSTGEVIIIMVIVVVTVLLAIYVKRMIAKGYLR